MALTLKKIFNILPPVNNLYVVAQIRNGALTDKIYISSETAAEYFFEILRQDSETHLSACVFLDLHVFCEDSYYEHDYYKVFRTYDLGLTWKTLTAKDYNAWYGYLFDIYHTADDVDTYEDLLDRIADNGYDQEEKDIVF